MQRNVTELKCLVNGKEIIFICDAECNTFEAKEALCFFIKHIGNIEDAHAAKRKEEQESKKEVVDDSKVEIIEA